ncbi:lasso peptide biosynthesis B2 protein [Streptomyces sp. NPDC094034]|uniref:lasso peptide biosynthesis B2 protein n=1 Tax=Streptomyces sp. NPDC094034 TaxID=3155309 RepID=UPI0033285247
MSVRALNLETPESPPWRRRPAALCAVATARVLAKIPPRRLRSVLEFARRGARPATEAETLRARNDVVSVSVPVAGPRCLQRSIAVVLLCRAKGFWPDWCTGVRTQPFQAHAWVAVNGRPVGENNEEVKHFHVQLTVPSRP